MKHKAAITVNTMNERCLSCGGVILLAKANTKHKTRIPNRRYRQTKTEFGENKVAMRMMKHRMAILKKRLPIDIRMTLVCTF